MPQELKVRITNYLSVEEKIKQLKADFIEELFFTDIYSNQPEGEVLKVSETNDNYYLIALKRVDGKFKEVTNKKLTKEEFAQTKEDLKLKYGIKRILQGKRRIFRLDDLRITFNLIDNVGEFLILTGENPTEQFVTEVLGIKNPEYICVSFDDLPAKSSN